MDDCRCDIYTNNTNLKEIEDSYFFKMRRYFFKQSSKLGYSYIDMREAFSKHFTKHEQRFEFPFDGHWNKLGHQVVAQTIQSSSFWKKIKHRKKSNFLHKMSKR